MVEWLPVFIVHAAALVALEKTGTCVLLCLPYTVGKFMFVYGYGSGDSDFPVRVSPQGLQGLVVIGSHS